MRFNKHQLDWDLIRDLTAKGMSRAEITEIIVCSNNSVSYALKRMGLKANPAKRDPSPNRELARELKQSGHTYAEIGKIMEVSPQRAVQLVMPPDKERREIIQRANGVCEECGRHYEILHAHHESYDKGPSHVLCASCHGQRHPPPHSSERGTRGSIERLAAAGVSVDEISRRLCLEPEIVRAHLTAP